MLPGAVAVGASRQASRDAVTVVLVPQEYLTLGKGVLQTEANSYRLVFLKLRATLSSKAAVFNHACSWLLDYQCPSVNQLDGPPLYVHTLYH